MALFETIARRRVRPAVLDVVLAVVVALSGPSALAAVPDGPPMRELDGLGYGLFLLAAAPLAGHRRWPLPVLAVVMAAAVTVQGMAYLPPLAGPWGPSIGPTYCGLAATVFLTALRTPARTALVALAVLTPAGALGVGLLVTEYRVSSSVTFAALLVAPWALGRLVRARRAMSREVLRRAAAVEREQAANARAAVAQERTRIARELHDIVAHNVSLMVVQTIAADRVQDRDRAKAHELHKTIEETGRATVTELRRLLGVLRTDDEDEPDPTRQPPQPTIAAIPELVRSVRAAGLHVDVETGGEPVPLPAGSELAAYRVVQEALTNTLKHAGHDGHIRARLTLDWQQDPARLAVRVCDDGRPAAAPLARTAVPDGSGHGLVGMGERIAAAGGVLHTGPRPGGGYCVHATIPVPTPADTASGGTS
ncbi:sensor histidine kinase [Streptomyces sp. Ru87]|uniref:sensor histidine kinase n=1 Tax=Streptomyces sp. Ru87 TaxID=2044307 RepID=UPI000BF4F2A7|nr:histidine kinase [Streptomyces sp. Ru87]PGH50677.1 two-component sensor histidine kinase [Streptomyces sp. Ru87]